MENRTRGEEKRKVFSVFYFMEERHARCVSRECDIFRVGTLLLFDGFVTFAYFSTLKI